MSFDAEGLNAKIALLGESMVGKTSIVNVIHGGKFIPEQTSTVGACFQIKKLTVNDTTINLHLWDTAGQERFRALAPMYYRDCQIALLVFAIDNIDSYSTVERWHAGLVDDCVIMPKVVIVGNKKDLRGDEGRSADEFVTVEQGKMLAEKLNATYFEISAKCDAEGVLEMFTSIAEMAISDLHQANQPGKLVDPGVRTRDKRKGCC